LKPKRAILQTAFLEFKLYPYLTAVAIASSLAWLAAAVWQVRHLKNRRMTIMMLCCLLTAFTLVFGIEFIRGLNIHRAGEYYRELWSR